MISPNEYAERRQRAVNLMESPSIMILYSGVEKVSSADEGYPFEVNRNFYYLTGIDQPDSVLLLLNSEGEMKEFLFISPYDERKEKWYGKRLKSEEASAISGISNVMTNISLPAKLDLILGEDAYGEVSRVYLDLDREIKIADDTDTREMKRILENTYSEIIVNDAFPLITTLRLRKSAREVEEFREAIRVTKLGIYAIWANMKDGMKEYELADVFHHIINDENGYQGVSFNTIMASGRNAAILHYPNPQGIVKDGDLLLSDLGSRHNYYCADITRCAPVNGKFNDFQRLVYGIVLGCNKMIASIAKPGVTIEELQNATIEYLSSECLRHGIIEKKEDISKYYFHGVSHLIGLDTHDPYKVPCTPEYKKLKLEPGMIISDEPGLYIAEKNIGVRIEDDLLITKNGCEVLSKDIVKEIDDIEMRLAPLKK